MTPSEMKTAPVLIQRHIFRDEGEEQESRKLTGIHRRQIENQMYAIMEEKCNMAASMIPGADYLMCQEFLRGQLTAMQYILALDDVARSTPTEL